MTMEAYDKANEIIRELGEKTYTTSDGVVHNVRCEMVDYIVSDETEMVEIMDTDTCRIIAYKVPLMDYMPRPNIDGFTLVNSDFFPFFGGINFAIHTYEVAK